MNTLKPTTFVKLVGKAALAVSDRRRPRPKKKRWIRDAWSAPMPQIFQQGNDSFWKNNPCPFERNTMEYREWHRGFNHAYFVNMNSAR